MASLARPSVLFVGAGFRIVLGYGLQGAVGVGPISAVPVGAALGGVIGLVGEIFSRLWLIRGETNIDPSERAIWSMTRPMSTVAPVFVSVYS